MCGNSLFDFEYSIINSSVQGASHKKSKLPNQDSYKIVEIPNAVIIAVADGHGNKTCLHSKKGSAMADRVFCSMMSDLLSNYADDMDALKLLLSEEGNKFISDQIEKEWKRRIIRSYRRLKNTDVQPRLTIEEKKSIWQQYGTTLLGLVMTPTFVFAYQLGDGDIVLSEDSVSKRIIESDGLLGTDTFSLSGINAWKYSKSTVIPIPEIKDSCSIMLSTDGFSNSYSNDEVFFETAHDYHLAIKKYGADTIQNNLSAWLKETSSGGSGDDITVVIVYTRKKVSSPA